MTLLIAIATILVLGIIVFQDAKYRAISWYLIPILLVLFSTQGIQKLSLEEWIVYFTTNVILLAINLFGVFAIISLREKRITNIINSYIGLGDILFFVVLAGAFSPMNFLIFYIGSVLISCIALLIWKQIKNNTELLFPLAGIISALLIPVLVLSQLYKSIDLFNDLIFAL